MFETNIHNSHLPSDAFETAKESSLPLSDGFETDITLFLYHRTCSKPGRKFCGSVKFMDDEDIKKLNPGLARFCKSCVAKQKK